MYKVLELFISMYKMFYINVKILQIMRICAYSHIHIFVFLVKM
eukprot:UN11777